jgi:hypothetical protein
MLQRHNGWLIGGAALGLTLAFAVAAYQVVAWDSVRPIAIWLLWPTSLIFVIGRSYPGLHDKLLFGVAVLGNAILYGLLAKALRRALLGLAVLAPILIWTFSPPSDVTLTGRFAEHRSELEQLAKMANSDTRFIKITPGFVVTDDRKTLSISDPRTMLGQARGAEYKRLFDAAGLKDELYGGRSDGEVFLSVRRLSKVDPVGSSFGYLYCPVPNEKDGLLPCIEDQESGKKGPYRWKRLESKWYLYEVFDRGIE